MAKRKEPSFTPASLLAATAAPEIQTRQPDAIIPVGAPLERIAARLERDVEFLGLRGSRNKNMARRTIRDVSGNAIEPVLNGIGDRSKRKVQTWKTVSDRKKSCILRQPEYCQDAASDGNASFQRKLENETDLLNAYWGWVGIMEPEYDLLEPWTLIDTESYFERAIKRRLDLAFRNGVEIVGENQTFVNYIRRRLDTMAYVMKKTWVSFLKDILKNLLVCSNVVLIKIRDQNASAGKSNEKNGDRTPVAGYSIAPPQTIFPYLDGKGRIEKWRRLFGMGRPFQDYVPEDIIHLCWNRKPGHLFGTPLSNAVRDDIFALRRLEENVELLLVNHLFPLFHVQVGTPEAPCQITADGYSEIDIIKRLIQEMPKEGVLVTDERVQIDVHGAAKEGIDPSPLLTHYQQRVWTGLGMSGIDLGVADSGNRSTADNVSQNLKDSIKADTDECSDLVKMTIFRDMFEEAPVALSVQNAVADVRMEFHEIDVDTQIKKETHAANMFNNHGITQTEFRKRMKQKPLEKDQEKDTHFEKHVVGLEKAKGKISEKLQDKQLEVQKELAKEQMAHQAKVETHKAASTKTSKVTRKFANGGSHTKETTEPTSHAAKAAATMMQPTNQHGKNLDPHKAKSSQDPDLLKVIYDELLRLRGEVPNQEDWISLVNGHIDLMMEGPELMTSRDILKSYVRLSDDPDILWLNLQSWAQNPMVGE